MKLGMDFYNNLDEQGYNKIINSKDKQQLLISILKATDEEVVQKYKTFYELMTIFNKKYNIKRTT